MMKIMEIWKTIEDYPNYQVSNMGRVKSLNFNRTGEEKIMKSIKTKNGYLRVVLSKKGNTKRYLIHRLVAQAFIPNPNNKPHIDHIDTIRTDNRVENLRWATRSENQNNPITKKKKSDSRKGEKHPLYGKFGKDNPKSKPILQFNKEGNFIRKWDNATQVKKELGFNTSNISLCCRGKRYKSVGGFKWGYADEYEQIPFNVFDLELYRKRVA